MRKILIVTAVFANATLPLAHAQEIGNAAFPSRTVEMILPYAAGGGVDAMGRAFASEAGKLTQQQWIVVNREGAGGVIGFGTLARAKGDGYTMAFSPASPLTNSPFLNSKLPFKNPEIEPVCQVFENVFAVAVKEDSPIKSFKDLMDQARERPGTLSYGHAGPGSIPHLSIAALERATKVRFNPIAYRGDGAMLTDVMGGTLNFSVPALSTIVGKKLRVLAVLADSRQPAMPDVPSLRELGYPTTSPGLNGLFLPASTPKSVLSQAEDICKRVTASTAFIESARALMQVPKYLPSTQFKKRLEATYQANASLIPELQLEKN